MGQVLMENLYFADFYETLVINSEVAFNSVWFHSKDRSTKTNVRRTFFLRGGIQKVTKSDEGGESLC